MTKVTIKDVAKKTGFSKSTVSYALNGKDGVGEEARQTIINCAQEMGYIPNIFAKSLSGRSYNTIGVILRDLTNPFYANVFCAIDKFCESRHYETIFYNLAGDPKRIQTGLDLMRGKMVSGIILDFFGNDDNVINRIKKSSIPTVIFGMNIDADISCVQADDENGAREAIDYAVNCGHKDIFYITNRKDDVFNDRRNRAIHDRLQFHGLSCEDNVVMLKENEDIAMTILNKCPQNSVLICYNDILACSIISSLMKERKFVPEDYSVIGFDNLKIIPYSLTSVDIPQYEMAEEASKLLFEQIEEHKTEKITLSSTLVIRDSVKDMK